MLARPEHPHCWPVHCSDGQRIILRQEAHLVCFGRLTPADCALFDAEALAFRGGELDSNNHLHAIVAHNSVAVKGVAWVWHFADARMRFMIRLDLFPNRQSRHLAALHQNAIKVGPFRGQNDRSRLIQYARRLRFHAALFHVRIPRVCFR